MTDAHTSFVAAVRHAAQTFKLPKYKKEYRRLSPRFWVAWLDLELGCECEDWDKLTNTMIAAHHQLGAPGDFGYGTPCGDALRNVYDTWRELCQARKIRQEEPKS
ncbi:hypothetical protein LCGC14_1231080 [marine sediment metagenome]|uniref:Uncharacterized protein n=1 Tax=marine sediment metagenome TaxID=412755 RepID=A0A0F9LVR2_9ZZZZ